jgi:hypothetical protein
VLFGAIHFCVSPSSGLARLGAVGELLPCQKEGVYTLSGRSGPAGVR